MGNLGEKLRKAREAKGLTLENLFEETKIQVRHLKALEEEEFRLFPGEVYVRGALRNYAEVVGLTYPEVLALYQETLKGESLEAAPPPPAQEKPIEKVEILRPSRKRRRSKPVLLYILLVLVLAFLAYIAGLYLLDREQDPGNGEIPAVDDPAGDPQEPGEKPQEPGKDPPPPVTLERPNPNREAFVLKGAEALEITVSFQAECWMRVTEAGEVISSGTYRRGQTYTVESGKNLVIRLGYPLGVESFTVNGLQLPVKEQRFAYSIEISLDRP